MKKIKSLLACLAAFLVTATLPAWALNSIEAHMGPVRVVVLSPTAIFGADHTVRAFSSTVSLTKGGAPYEPDGTSWVRYTDKTGQVVENRISNFGVLSLDHIGFDGALATPYRPVPAAAIETIAVAHVGDTNYIVSLRLLTTATAHVIAVHPDNYTIDLDYPADSGDSGSVVLTGAGTFVGFISAKLGEPSTGSVASVPPSTTLPPAPIPPAVTPPEPVPPPVLPVLPVRRPSDPLRDDVRSDLLRIRDELQTTLDRLK